MFLAGLVPVVLGMFYLLLYYVFHVDLYDPVRKMHLQCQFKTLTGLYCPGCGGTRACLALLKLRPLASFLYHPLPLYCFLLYANFMLRYVLSELFPGKVGKAKYRTVYVVILCVLLIGNWVLRNFLLLKFGIRI